MLLVLWALMCYTALLLVEVYQHESHETGIGSVAQRYLGPSDKFITGFSMMFLMYALTAAYVSGAGEIITSNLKVVLPLIWLIGWELLYLPLLVGSCMFWDFISRFYQPYFICCENCFLSHYIGVNDTSC